MTDVVGLGAALAGKSDKYSKVAIVAQSGGDYQDPATAVNYQAYWCGTPSSSNRCLVKIMPGEYDVPNGVSMAEYMDIEGSGENSTVIIGDVSVMNNSEIRFLTIQHGGIFTGPLSPKLTNITIVAEGQWGILNYHSSPVMNNVTVKVSRISGDVVGIWNESGSPIMNNVTVTAVGSVGNSGVYGIINAYGASSVLTNVTAAASGGTFSCGINIDGSSPVITNSAFTASGTETNQAIRVFSSSLVLNNVTAVAKNGSSNYGLWIDGLNGGSDVQIDRSTFEGATGSIASYYSFGNILRIGSSKLIGPFSPAGTTICVGAYNGDYSPLDANCQ